MIEFHDLGKPAISEWLSLFNDPKSRKYMPLAEQKVDENWIKNWLISKINSIETSPFKLHSIWHGMQFVGWGGIQQDESDFEIAIVLKPSAWGCGREIADRLIDDFKEAKLDASLYIYLPLMRNSSAIARKLDLLEVGEITIARKTFKKLLINLK